MWKICAMWMFLLLTCSFCRYVPIGCGQNTKGELGIWNDINQNLPVFNTSLNDIIQISSGNQFSHFLTSSKSVFAVGQNSVSEHLTHFSLVNLDLGIM